MAPDPPSTRSRSTGTLSDRNAVGGVLGAGGTVGRTEIRAEIERVCVGERFCTLADSLS